MHEIGSEYLYVLYINTINYSLHTLIIFFKHMDNLILYIYHLPIDKEINSEKFHKFFKGYARTVPLSNKNAKTKKKER